MPALEALRERLPVINAWLQSEIDAGRTPGAAVGILAHGEVIFA